MPEDITAPETQATEPTPQQQPTEIKNPDAVLKALESERQARKELEKQLKAFQGVDVSKWQEYTAAEAKREQEKVEAEKKRLEEKGAYEALTAKQREEHQRELKAIQDQLEAIKTEKEAVASQVKEKDSAIARMKLESKALKAYLAEGGDSEEDFGDFIWAKLSKHVVSTEDGGIQVIKENGDLWLDDKKNPLNLRGLFAQFREGRGAKFFKPQNTAEGGGMQPSGKSAATTQPRTITREQAASRNFLLKNKISLEDISSGKVIVDFDS